MDRLHNAVRRIASDLDGQQAAPRSATVAAFDPTTHTVKVTVQPEGVTSGWIPLGAIAVGDGVGVVIPPNIGDPVDIVFSEGDIEHPRIVGRNFHLGAMPPVSPATGQPVMPGEVGIFTQGCWLHLSGGKLFAQAEGFDFTGPLKVTGPISATENITTEADVIAGSISLQKHLTTDVESGNSVSGLPK